MIVEIRGFGSPRGGVSESPYKKVGPVSVYPREDAGGLSREYVLRIPSVS